MKRLFLVLMLSMFLISCVSAFSFTSVEGFTKDQTTSVYGKYQIYEKDLFLFKGDLVKEYELETNTELCGGDNGLCQSYFTSTLFKEGTLVDKWNIYNKTSMKPDTMRWMRLEYFGDVIDYETVCEKGETIYDEKNETEYTPETCMQKEVGSHKDWIQFKEGQIFQPNTYEWRAIGDKAPWKDIEWTFITRDIETTKWSTWGAVGGANSWVNLTSPANNSIQYVQQVSLTANASAYGGAYLTNATFYDNSTGSWGARNTTDVFASYYNNTYSSTVTSCTTPLKPINVYNNIYTFNPTIVTNMSVDTRTSQNAHQICSKWEIVYTNGTHYNTTEDCHSEVGQVWTTFTDTNPNPLTLTSQLKLWTKVAGSCTSDPLDTNAIRNVIVNGKIVITNSTQTFTNTYSTNTLWNMQFCDTDGDCGFAPSNYTFSVDAVAPQLTLNYPTALIDYGKVNGTLQLNFTATDVNLDKVWYNYNGTNITVTGATSGVYNLSNITLSSKKNITIYANDTAENLNSSTFTWDYKVFENSQNYTTPVYETQLVSFTINLTYDNTASLTATLNYDGTSYTAINTGSGNNALFSTPSFNIPLINATANKTFYWILNYNNSITVTPSQIQTVNPLIVSQCNGTYTIKALNFTFFEEQNQTNLNATANPTTFLFNIKYWIGDGAVQKNYSYQNLSSSLNNFQFCLNENLSYQSDVDVQYFASNYAERTFYMRNHTISNVTQNITLYNLLSSEATKFTINLRQSTEVFADALVEIKKYYTGLNAYKLVMIGLTDAKGKFTTNIDLDQTYNFSVIKDGINYGNFVKEAICQVTPCEIDLNVDLITLNPNDVFYDYFAQNVDYNLTQNDTEQMVYLDFQDTLGTAHYWRLLVTSTNLNNDTVITICDTTAYSTSGSMSCNYTGYEGELSAKVFISRSPEKLVDFINWVNSLDYKTFGESAVLASVIIVLIIFFTGVRNPVTALVLIPFALVVLKLIQLMPLTWGWILGILIVDFWLIRRVNT